MAEYGERIVTDAGTWTWERGDHEADERWLRLDFWAYAPPRHRPHRSNNAISDNTTPASRMPNADTASGSITKAKNSTSVTSLAYQKRNAGPGGLVRRIEGVSDV